MTLLHASHLHHAYGGLVALDDVTVEVAPGEIVGIVGPNGCGKSTLLNAVSGHLLPDRGVIEFCGIDVTSRPPDSRARMGLSRTFQIVRLMEPLTAVDNVMLGLHTSNTRGRRARVARATAALTLMGIAELARSPVRRLSNGQRRRVEIARSLVRDAPLLILDEPTAGLTADVTAHLVDILRQQASAGVGILVVAHERAVIDALCTTIVTMSGGRIIDVHQSATPSPQPPLQATA